VLRRYGISEKGGKQKTQIMFPDLKMDLERHEVSAKGKPVVLSAKEFKLLEFLASNKEKVFSRERLLDDVWGIQAEVETRTVDVHIRRLREKLGKAGGHIQTVIGFGYKFKE
jgi:DNA-binding response OmpR family regulator